MTSIASARATVTPTRVRRSLFYLVAVGLVALAATAFAEPLRFGLFVWTPGYEFPTHRVHHVALGVLAWAFLLGLLAQLYRPERRVGAFQVSAILLALLVAQTGLLEGAVAALELAVFVVPFAALALIHPARGRLVPRVTALDRHLLAVAAVGAGAFVAFGAYQFALQGTLSDAHVAFGHYGFMAVWGFAVAVAALLASLRSEGWRALAAFAGVAAALAGAMAIAVPGPEQGANFGRLGGGFALLWAAVFLAVVYRSGRDSDPVGSPDATGPD